MSALLDALEDYDGKRTEVLELIRDGLQPAAAHLPDAIECAAHADGRVAAGATWLLRAWVEAGVECDAASVAELAAVLPSIVDPWARQHVCQAVRSLTIPKASAAAFAKFLRAGVTSDRPFLRAWAVDGLHRLAGQHGRYAAAARDALAAAEQDPKASVRARARRIAKGE